MRNPVARHVRTFNRATTHRDKTKRHRPSEQVCLDEWYEDENDGFDYPGLVEPKEFETPSISLMVYKRSFLTGERNERTTSTPYRAVW